MPITTLLELLDANKRSVPRPLLSLAVWNVLAQCLQPAFRTQRRAVARLDSLLQYVIGLDLEAASVIYDENSDPLLVLARQYNLIDYRWEWLPQRDLSTAKARLELCVQQDFTTLEKLAEPHAWSTTSPFWSTFRAAPSQRRTAARSSAAPTNFHGRLTLPGAERSLPVKMKIDRSNTGLSAINDFEILESDDVAFCRGFFKVEKELGRPGATRITHEKQVRFSGGQLDDFRIGAIAYWLQADTVCLVLPH